MHSQHKITTIISRYTNCT